MDEKRSDIKLNPNTSFFANENGSIEVRANLKGTDGHWHITGLVNGEKKAYFILLHPKYRRPQDIGAEISGQFILNIKKGDKILLSTTANKNDVLEQQLNFSATYKNKEDEVLLKSFVDFSDINANINTCNSDYKRMGKNPNLEEVIKLVDDYFLKLIPSFSSFTTGIMGTYTLS